MNVHKVKISQRAASSMYAIVVILMSHLTHTECTSVQSYIYGGRPFIKTAGIQLSSFNQLGRALTTPYLKPKPPAANIISTLGHWCIRLLLRSTTQF